MEYLQVLAVLREFTEDIEAVGIEQTAKEWPDLLVTYRKAKKALAAQQMCKCGSPLYGLMRVHHCDEGRQ